MFYKEEGASPVIAEILMVAITVILIVVLYLFVIGGYFSTPYAIDQLTATLSFDPQKSTESEVYFNIAMSSPQSTKLENVKITVNAHSTIAHLTYRGNFLWSNATPGGKWHYEARLQDNDGNGEFSNGDTLIVSIKSSSNTPVFQSGDKVAFSITGYNGISAGGVIQS